MNIRYFQFSIAFILVTAGSLACHTQGSIAVAQTPAPAPNVVEITATDYAFRAPEEITSGWTTIQFRNEGEEPHFVFLTRLPDGKTIEHYETDLSAVFNDAWVSLRDGHADINEAMTTMSGALPEWFPSVYFIGGPGFTAPGTMSETTLHMEPGNYVIECYMKTEDGEFHYMEGMIRPLLVTTMNAGASPPTADIWITLSNFEMTIEGEITPGRHTIGVQVAENPEEGFGHSVHIARIEPETDVNEVVKWMNAFDLIGLRTPAPAEFIGGTHMQMPVGQPQYLTVDLEPGRYLFISEATAHMGVLQEVTVK